MTKDEKIQKLQKLPWNALQKKAIELGIQEKEIGKYKDKSELIAKILLNEIKDEEIDKLIDDYIYGDRVTFTLWSFDHALVEDDYKKLSSLLEKGVEVIDSKKFRNLKFISVVEKDERIEILYVYSKEYTYTNEEGKGASIWEQHRGCLWVGCNQSYLAVISKHEKMTSFIIDYIGTHLSNLLSQINMPEKAIDESTKPEAISRVVMQG